MVEGRKEERGGGGVGGGEGWEVGRGGRGADKGRGKDERGMEEKEEDRKVGRSGRVRGDVRQWIRKITYGGRPYLSSLFLGLFQVSRGH